MSLGSWITERVRGSAGPAVSTVPVPSVAYVFGWVIVTMLALEAVTGAALAAFYAPTTTHAWASVAYVQDQMACGWLVRGLHHHGASALMIVSGLHLVQTAVWGSYKRPRELVWWIGVILILLVLAFAITGYVLRWDQEGYWANQVEVGIAAGTPVVGATIKKIALGGNDYGNLTLTRFYALHVALLPAIVALLVVAHIVIARRHGATPHWSADAIPPAPSARWPRQTFRAALAVALAFAALLAYVVYVHGAGLAAPADPTASFDARPLWYFRWLFALRKLAGSAEEIVALAIPAVVMGALVVLPFVDHTNERHPLRRKLAVGGVVGLLAIIGALTAMSLWRDMGNKGYQKRALESAQVASHMRELAVKYGVPATGPQDLLAQQPMYRARKLFAQYCESCHDAKSKDRKGPIIAPGHGSRAWLAGMLKAPSDVAYWGKTKLAGRPDDAMKPVELAADALGDLVEALYAEGGAPDIDAAKRDRGKAVYNDACNDCHSLEEGAAGSSAPGLGGLKSREWYVSFISNPKSAQHMGPDKSEMPRFDKELSIEDRDRLAQYLVWLRTATQHDVDALGPL